MSRKLRPREPITTAPSHVSQLNCAPLLGIDPRRFLDFLRAEQIPHACIGKLRIAEVEVLRDRLRKLSTSTGVDIEQEDLGEARAMGDDDQPRSVDAVLAKLGRRRTT